MVRAAQAGERLYHQPAVLMSVPSPKAMRADAQRNHDAILGAAKAVFAQVGADAPMEDVARAAGVGEGTLYRRFPTRERRPIGRRHLVRPDEKQLRAPV